MNLKLARLIYISFLVLLCQAIKAQDLSKRYSFAKAYFGLDVVAVPSYGQSNFLSASGTIRPFQRNAFITPSINIGATHFWGYADIYVSITTTDIKLRKDELKNATDFGVFTGFRLYPLAINDHKVRPFIGYKFSPFRYQQSDINGSTTRRTTLKSTFDVGVGYRLPNFYFFLGYNRVVNPNTKNYLSRTISNKITLPKHFLNIGFNWMVETTSFAKSPINQHFNEEFSKTNKDGFFIGVGPSSAFPIQKSNYIEDLYPFLDDISFPTIFPDIALGYHFTKIDVVTALAVRPIIQTRKALNFEQKIKRNSFILEGYKFVGDYHGFVPFFGAGLSYENLTLTEKDQEISITNKKENNFTPLLVFGWDIRPSRKGDWWVLRTNLRYSPSLKLKHLGKYLSLQHLEFNFIQFVCYPQRLKKYKNHSL